MEPGLSLRCRRVINIPLQNFDAMAANANLNDVGHITMVFSTCHVLVGFQGNIGRLYWKNMALVYLKMRIQDTVQFCQLL